MSYSNVYFSLFTAYGLNFRFSQKKQSGKFSVTFNKWLQCLRNCFYRYHCNENSPMFAVLEAKLVFVSSVYFLTVSELTSNNVIFFTNFLFFFFKLYRWPIKQFFLNNTLWFSPHIIFYYYMYLFIILSTCFVKSQKKNWDFANL